MLVLCKPILELLTEHHAPCSGHSEQDCLAGFQDVDFGTLKGLWEGLNSSLFFLSLGVTGNQPNQLHLNSVGPGSSQSPMGMNLPGQQPLSHEPPPTSMMSSPNPLGSNIPMHPSGPGAGVPPQNPMMLPPEFREMKCSSSCR